LTQVLFDFRIRLTFLNLGKKTQP